MKSSMIGKGTQTMTSSVKSKKKGTIMVDLTKYARQTLAALGFLGLTCVSINAAAAVITVGTGPSGFGGTLTSASGSNFAGSDINLGTLTVGDVPNSSGVYAITDGKLNFSTSADTITVEGSIAGLGIINQTLISGTFENWSYSNSGSTNLFSAGGFNIASDDLLNAFGVAPGTNFDFDVYTIEVDSLGEVVATNLVTTSVVPVPAAAWLMGSGLFTLVAIARRNNNRAAGQRLTRSKRTA